MAWAPLLLVVLAHSSGSLVQAALTQPPSVSANPGETVQITCSDISTSYAYVGWYQQKVPGTAPVTVIYWNDRRPTDIPSRFSGSLSGTMATLTVTEVEAGDDAVYYCGGWNDSTARQCPQSGQDRGSGGHRVLPDPAPFSSTLTGQPKAVPDVHLFPPPAEEMAKEKKATLVCLLGDFYPGAATVTWLADGRAITSGVETSKPQRQSNNKYMASSYLTLSAAEWQNHEKYVCQVTHEAGNVEKSLNRSECS
ncbi:IGL1 protein, partial [Brachypteracias leptosomus]|nr:IGL1 protein [Brachypteracias leptosomus]